MFRKILIANRGEIALRILRACRELGVKAVVVYSEADRHSLPVILADQAICLGPGPALDSYLNMARVLEAGYVTGCDALHPGYGFLAERPGFVEATADTHMTFIGPSPDTMRRLGDKIEARKLALQVGVPFVPGSVDEVRELTQAARIAAEIGYPIMIKAAAGGGGKGMRLVRSERELETGFRLCQAEARAAFGDGRVYIEKMITNFRHIEIQILADRFGNIIHLGERDCTAQRRHQKYREEAPSPVVHPELRTKLGDWAIALARASDYIGAGTVEFLVDDQQRCYFIEVNCRLQVEHPITELITGIDIVRTQILIAAGEQLPKIVHHTGSLRGHAVECRICAEDPDADFEPKAGCISELHFAGGPGVRIDSHLMPGYSIPPFYDSLIAKIITWAPDRHTALARMRRALEETIIRGIPTTIQFQLHELQELEQTAQPAADSGERVLLDKR